MIINLGALIYKWRNWSGWHRAFLRTVSLSSKTNYSVPVAANLPLSRSNTRLLHVYQRTSPFVFVEYDEYRVTRIHQLFLPLQILFERYQCNAKLSFACKIRANNRQRESKTRQANANESLSKYLSRSKRSFKPDHNKQFFPDVFGAVCSCRKTLQLSLNENAAEVPARASH